MSEIIKFLVESGALGIFTLSCILAIGVLWRHLVGRERKHDEDRDEWLSSLLSVSQSATSSQERIASSLKALEEGQKRLYDLYHAITGKK